VDTSYTFTSIYKRVYETRRVDNTTEYRGKQLNRASNLRISLISVSSW